MTDNIENFINKKISLIIDDDEEGIIQLSDIIEERFSDDLNFSYDKNINNLYDYWRDCKEDEQAGVFWELIYIDETDGFNACHYESAKERRQKTVAMTVREILEDNPTKEISENELLDLFEV